MKIKNHAFYMNLSSKVGLRFIDINNLNSSEVLTLEDLNKKGLKFVAAIKNRDKATERDFVVAIFESEADETKSKG
jgi:hypothetical protein